METRLLRGIGAPGGKTAAHQMTALLTFRSKQDFQRAAQQHGRKIMGDVKNFTDVKPAVQFNEYAQ